MVGRKLSPLSPHARSCTFAVLTFLIGFGCGTGGPGGGNPIGGGLFNAAPSVSLTVSPSDSVPAFQSVTLDASGSTDPDGDALSFEWSQTGGPGVSLNSNSASSVSFDAPDVSVETVLTFRVEVSDGRGGRSTADVSVTVRVAADFAGNAQRSATYREQLTADEAYHLLRRAALGAKPEEVAAAVQRGLSATVDDLLTVKPVPPELTALVDSYEDDIPHRWLIMLLDGPNPLQERMAMFWHDRFATSRRVLSFNDRNLAVLHWRMLRDNALGDYRVFLERLTLDPLMLIWLDGANSPKAKPNENYTREFWELFTLGRDVLYTEHDIREGSRAFTGITLLRQQGQDARPIFDLINHDESAKHVFPDRAPPANHNYQSIINLTLAQPEAPRYVARNLFVYFVHDHPSDALVQELADSFRDSGFQIAPLVRRILTSQAMFSAEARGAQISSPVEHVIGVARTLDMHPRSEDAQGFILDRLSGDLAGAGQELLDPPGVQGWTEGEAWLEDQWVLNRARALGRRMEYGPGATTALPYHLLPDRATWNQREARGQIVDSIAGVFHLVLSTEERDIYLEVLDQKGYLAFHLENPNNQPQHVIELIKLMAMDPRVLVR